MDFVSAQELFYGVGANTFAPNAEMTRGMLVTVLARYAGVDLQGYTDADLVSGYATEAMSWAVGIGLMKGPTPTQLDPQGNATRGQVAAAIMRYAQIIGP